MIAVIIKKDLDTAAISKRHLLGYLENLMERSALRLVKHASRQIVGIKSSTWSKPDCDSFMFFSGNLGV